MPVTANLRGAEKEICALVCIKQLKALYGGKMDAKVFLNQVQKYNAMIRNKICEIEVLRNKVFDISASTEEVRVQKTGCNSKIECMVVSYLDMEKELDEEIKMLQEQKNKVVEVIEQLPLKEYDFLYRVYVVGVPMYEVANMAGHGKSWARSINLKALKNVQKILDEQEEKIEK